MSCIDVLSIVYREKPILIFMYQFYAEINNIRDVEINPL